MKYLDKRILAHKKGGQTYPYPFVQAPVDLPCFAESKKTLSFFVLALPKIERGCLIGTTFFPGGNEVSDDASDVVESDGEDEEDEDDLFEYLQDVEDDQDQRGSNRYNKQVVWYQ